MYIYSLPHTGIEVSIYNPWNGGMLFVRQVAHVTVTGSYTQASDVFFMPNPPLLVLAAGQWNPSTNPALLAWPSAHGVDSLHGYLLSSVTCSSLIIVRQTLTTYTNIVWQSGLYLYCKHVFVCGVILFLWFSLISLSTKIRTP
jgi:hypothetical protein